MKLLQLKIKGITSFKDEVEINFESYLRGNNLFAITGATGSGKSSILTSIFLALYGKSPKGVSPSEVVNTNSQEADIELKFMLKKEKYKATWACKTHGQSGELKRPKVLKQLFIKNKTNQIFQEIEKSAEDILGLTMEQFEKTIIINQGKFSDFITSKSSDRRKLLETLFQFQEISLLSPSLKREIKETEREIESYDIKIESSTLYDKEQIQEMEQSLKHKKNISNLLTSILEAYKSPAKDLTEITKTAKEIQADKKYISEISPKIEQVFEEYKNLDKQKKEKSIYSDKLIIQEKNINKNIKEIEGLINSYRVNHDKLVDINQQIEEGHKKSDKITQQKSQTRDKKTKLTNELNEIEQEIKEASIELSKAFNIETININSKQITSNDTQKLESLVRGLNQTISEIKYTRENLTQKAKELKDLESQANKIKENKQKIEDTVKSIIPELAESLPLSIDNILEQLNSEVSKSEKNLEQLNQSQAQLDSLQKEANFYNRENTNLNQKIVTETQNKSDLINHVKHLKETIKNEQEAQEKQVIQEAILTIKKQHKEKLETTGSEVECMVCGHEIERTSLTSHFHDSHNDIDNNLDAEKASSLKETQDLLISNELKIKFIDESINKAKDQIKTNTDYLNESSNKIITELLKKIPTLKDQTKHCAENLGPASIIEITKKYYDKIESLNKSITKSHKDLIEKVSLIQKTENDIKALNQRLEDYRDRYKHLKSDYTKHESSISDLKKRFFNSITKITQVLETNEETKVPVIDPNRIDNFINKWITNELAINEKTPFDIIIHALKKIDRTKTEIKFHDETNKNLDSGHLEINEQIKRLNNTKVQIASNLADSKSQLSQILKKTSSLIQEPLFTNREQNEKHINFLSSNLSFSDKTIDHEIKSHLLEIEKTIEDNLNKSKQELEHMTKNYYEKRRELDVLENNKSHKASNIEQRENLILELYSAYKSNSIFLIDKIDNFINQENTEELREEMIEIRKAFSKIAQANYQLVENQEHQELLSVFVEERLNRFKELINSSIQEDKAVIIELQTKLQTYYEKVKELDKTKELKEQKLKELTQKKNLLKIIGQDDFGRFAASFIEDQLLFWANNELKKLCQNRYQLTIATKNKNSGPEFFIIDYWKNAAQRHISTLSGGEIFLVSLAMALGLAELTKGHTEIDTLIIDEGFGTLDDQAIEDALGVLQHIANKGKHIGVISHVKELTQRIPININLNKNLLGESELNIVY